MSSSDRKKTICYFVGTHGDWGGASRIIFNIIRFIDKSRFEPIVMLSSKGEICDELEANKIKYIIWEQDKRNNLLSHINKLIKCIKFYRKEKVDIAVFSYGMFGWRPTEILSAKLMRIPVIQHCQRVVSKPSPYAKYSRLILTCSDYLLKTSAFVSENSRRLYDIVDTDKFSSGKNHMRKELGIKDSHIVITFLGRSRKIKGLETFISLTNALPDEKLRFFVAVQRIPKPNLDSYTNEEFTKFIESDPRILHVGYRQDVENIYAASDIIVMPSIGEEPCPAVVLEAAASGKPIVATDTGATKELVIDKETGFLVAKDDYQSLVNYVQILAEDSQLREEMGTKAKKLAEQKFFKEPIEQLHKMYTSL